MRDGNGSDRGWGGVYREIVRNERVVQTEKFDQPWYPGEALVTSTVVEEGGRTMLTTTVRYESKEARDGVLASPMQHGVAESYDRLDELLASKASAA